MVRKIINYGFSEGINKVIPFVLFLYLSDVLSVASFSNLGILYVINELFFLLLSINIHVTVRINYFKFSKEYFYSKYSPWLKFIFIFLTAVLILILVFSFYIDDYSVLSLLLVANFFRVLSCFFLAIFQCEEETRKFVSSNMAYTFSMFALTLFLVGFFLDYRLWAVALFFSSLFQLVFIAYNNKKIISSIRVNLAKKIDFSLIFDGVKFFPQAIGWWIKTGGERFIINNSYTKLVLANYTLAFQYASLFPIFISVINLVLVPEINKRLSVRENGKVELLIGKTINYYILFHLLLSVFIYYFIDYLHGYKYVDAKDIYCFISLGMLPQSLLLILINVIYFLEGPSYVARIVLSSFIFQFVLSFLISKYFDIYVVLILSSFVNIMLLVLVYFRIKKLRYFNED